MGERLQIFFAAVFCLGLGSIAHELEKIRDEIRKMRQR